MNNSSFYIPPNLDIFPTFEKLIEDVPLSRYFREEEKTKVDILSAKRVFVVAEPGYGKTRLLQEIINEAENGIFIDLKRMVRDIDSYIQEKLKIKYSDTNFFYSDNFKLENSEEVIVCLDALDEVRSQDFSSTVDRIKEFSYQYPKISLIVSCRLHFLKNYQKLFLKSKFQYAHISPFDFSQVREFLKKCRHSEEDIDCVLNTLKYRHGIPAITIPRYLEIFSDITKEKGIKTTRSLKKTELLELFIYHKLEIEKEKDYGQYTQASDLIKRILEKIALIMEMLQTNVLSKNDLMTFFDDISSNLSISFLHQVPLQTFFDKTLLKDNSDTIEFENTEFQEYLAAKEIIRLKRTKQTVFDVVVDPEIREIYPSWFNTLEFLVDLDISLFKPLLDFGTSQGRIVQFEGFHRLLVRTDANRLKADERKAVFALVFGYYQKVLHWIPFEVAENLTYYFDASQEELLKSSIDGREAKRGSEKWYVRRGNVAQLVDFFLEKNIFNEQQQKHWKKKLIEFAKDDNENGVLQRNAIYALRHFKDINIYKNIWETLKEDDSSIYDSFINACKMVNPNDPFSIERFVEGTKKENINVSVSSRSSLLEIKEKDSFKILFDYFTKDSLFLHKFIEHFDDKDKKVVLNIKSVLDNEIKEKIKDFIVFAFSSEYYYEAGRSSFINNLIKLVKETESDFLLQLISDFKKGSLIEKIYWLENFFVSHLEKNQVSQFVAELRDTDKGWLSFIILQKIKYSDRNDANDVYEEGRKYLRDHYEQAERPRKDDKSFQTVNIYLEFKNKLGVDGGEFYLDVFKFYGDNQKIIDQEITSQEKERLIHLITGTIFEKLNPAKTEFHITDKNKGRTSYTLNQWIPVFGDCLKLVRKLGIDISPYRIHIINYIPFSFNDLEQIFSLIPDPKENELSELIDIYQKKRADDLAEHRPGSFIKACERYSIKEGLAVLKKFVDQSDFTIYDRRKALEVIAYLSTNEENYFIEVFKKYLLTEGDEKFQLAEKSNELLIENYLNNDAVKWRFEQVTSRYFEFVRTEGVHSVGNQESELNNKYFAKPLMNIKSPEYKDKYLKLLEESFKIYGKRGHYWSYTKYLWDIVIAYYDNLKELRTYSYLKELEKFIGDHVPAKGLNWFKGSLRGLKERYLIYFGKQISVNDCINKYNSIKKNQYIDIATSFDLFNQLKNIFDTDIRRWIESEGAYKIFQAISISKVTFKNESQEAYKAFQKISRKQEELIQKTLKSQIELSLFKRGIRDCDIRREEQLLSDERPDFLVSYGFIGPIVIEFKLTKNNELKSKDKIKKYKNKFESHYMKGNNSEYGIFVLFQVDAQHPLEQILLKVRPVYTNTNIAIIGINCLHLLG